MKVSLNTTAQILAMCLQMLNQVSDIVPQDFKVWVMLVVSILQGVIGVIAHYSNPDGTPATIPWR